MRRFSLSRRNPSSRRRSRSHHDLRAGAASRGGNQESHPQNRRGSSVDDGVVAKLITAFRGLSRYEITRLLNRGLQLDGVIGEDDIALVREEKRNTSGRAASWKWCGPPRVWTTSAVWKH